MFSVLVWWRSIPLRWKNHRTVTDWLGDPYQKPPVQQRRLNMLTFSHHISHVLYMNCVKMFSFCNEQLTNGNGLTWCKCKNKTEQFKDSNGKTKKKIGTANSIGSHRTVLHCECVRDEWSVCSKWKKPCKIRLILWIVSIILVLWLLFTSLTNSVCNK